MNTIKQIIKESLLNEVGDASAQPYFWKLGKDSSNDKVNYHFKTKGGSKLTIEVSFILLAPRQIIDLFSDEDRMKRKEKLFYINNPYYYWDSEFKVTKYKDEDLDYDIEGSMTISKSEYKTDKVEVFRIMATISSIIKDFIKRNKVRGFAFRPASDSRSRVFMKYFQQQIPNAKILQLEDPHGFHAPATIITTDENVTYTKGEAGPYEEYENDEDKPPFRERMKSKFTKKEEPGNDYY